MGRPAHRRYTIGEFVRLEKYSNVRHEFLEGQVYAIASGTPAHGARAGNVVGVLTAQLRGQLCRVQTSDVRIRVKATGLDTYPDASVVCRHEERDAEDRDAIANPILLVEVLSPSTEEYDRGEKLEHYQRLASLQEVVFVAHDEWRVEVVRRRGADWVSLTARRGESVSLASVGCELPVDEIYRDPLAP
jgi:Uma2 family endonuclease